MKVLHNKDIDIIKLTHSFNWLGIWYKEGKTQDLVQKILAYELYTKRSEKAGRPLKYMATLLKQESSSDRYWKYLFVILNSGSVISDRKQFSDGAEALIYYTKMKEGLINKGYINI
jgi:hypothetical protein